MKKILLISLRKVIVLGLNLLNLVFLGHLPPVPVASMLVFGKRQRILGIIRSDGSGISLPGGIIRAGEDSSAAAVRETEEETGVKTKPVALAEVYSSRINESGIKVLEIVYLGRIVDGKIKKDSLEGKPGWFDWSEIEKQSNNSLRNLYPIIRKRWKMKGN